MDRRLNRPVALGAAGLLAVVGGGAAYAASSGTNPRDAVLNAAAQRLNVSPDKLRAALQGAFGDQLDQAVKDGKITQQQADRAKARIQRGEGLPPFGGLRHGFRERGAVGFGPGGDLKAAATYLGLTPTQLRDKLEGGKTLAEVAKATQGKSVDGLEAAIVADAKARLDKAVTDKRITSAQHDELLKQIQQHVDDLVAGKGLRFGMHFRGPGGPGMHGGSAGPGGWGGPPPLPPAGTP